MKQQTKYLASFVRQELVRGAADPYYCQRSSPGDTELSSKSLDPEPSGKDPEDIEVGSDVQKTWC